MVDQNLIERSPLNLAIVGGGKTCFAFLEMFGRQRIPHLNINIIGVCDPDHSSEALELARSLGIYTTKYYPDLFGLEGLNGILELSDDRDILLDIVKKRPKNIGILDYQMAKFVANFFDLTQRLETAEDQVVYEKMAVDFLIHQANERIVVMKPDFTIVEANEAYLKATNKSSRDVIGGRCYEITHGLTTPCFSAQPWLGCPVVETLRTGESAHVIHEHPSSDGNFSYCNMVAYPIKNKDGEIIRIIEVWRDITEELSTKWEKRAKALLDDFKKLIQEDRMISLGKLAASCVHEINNPIHGLLTFSHLMLDTVKKGTLSPEDLDEFNRFLTIMCDELDRCGNIISGLLSFSREPTLEYKDIDIHDVLKSGITLTDHKMELQEIKLETELSPHPLLLKGDVNQLQQCFLNLIFNAIEAMPDGGTLNLSTSLSGDKQKMFIFVKDTGCGIREADQEHIFDPFYTTKGEGEGTGLGLSIVYGIVKTHQGEIKVESTIDKGTTVRLSFPVHIP